MAHGPMELGCEGERDQDGRRCCDGPDVRRVVFLPRPDEFVSGPMGADWCAWCRETALDSGATFVSVA